MGRIVLGLEIDVQRTNLDEARDMTVAVAGEGPETETYLRVFGSDWTSTFRGRAGLLRTPRVLLYATAGIAAADVDTEDLVTFVGGTANGVTDARTRTGWTIGGGVEWTIATPWTIRLGYLYADFGSFVTTSQNSGAGGPATIDHEHQLQEHMVVAAFNVHFWRQ